MSEQLSIWDVPIQPDPKAPAQALSWDEISELPKNTEIWWIEPGTGEPPVRCMMDYIIADQFIFRTESRVNPGKWNGRRVTHQDFKEHYQFWSAKPEANDAERNEDAVD